MTKRLGNTDGSKSRPKSGTWYKSGTRHASTQTTPPKKQDGHRYPPPPYPSVREPTRWPSSGPQRRYLNNLIWGQEEEIRLEDYSEDTEMGSFKKVRFANDARKVKGKERASTSIYNNSEDEECRPRVQKEEAEEAEDLCIALERSRIDYYGQCNPPFRRPSSISPASSPPVYFNRGDSRIRRRYEEWLQADEEGYWKEKLRRERAEFEERDRERIDKVRSRQREIEKAFVNEGEQGRMKQKKIEEEMRKQDGDRRGEKQRVRPGYLERREEELYHSPAPPPPSPQPHRYAATEHYPPSHSLPIIPIESLHMYRRASQRPKSTSPPLPSPPTPRYTSYWPPPRYLPSPPRNYEEGYDEDRIGGGGYSADREVFVHDKLCRCGPCLEGLRELPWGHYYA